MSSNSNWYGLTSSEAKQRLVSNGFNELSKPPRRGVLRVLKGVLAEPMFLLLMFAAGIYLAVGELHEGLLLTAFAALAVGLVVVQQTRSEGALEALRTLVAPTARVVRDGHEQRIPAREVVVGDLLLISEGERVAADGYLRRCEGFSLDESLLTGESVPVHKIQVAEKPFKFSAPGGDGQPWIYAGTLAVSGNGMAEVTEAGSATQAGKIGLSLVTIETESTLLQKSIGRLVRLFGLIALVISLSVVTLYGLAYSDWLQGSLVGIAVAMSLLPEEFPMVLVVFVALGAWRLTRIKVLARRPAVIETLGATSVLCVDKTGTLTENRMRIRVLVVNDQTFELQGEETELPEAFHHLIEYAVLASKRQAFDPMDQAVSTLGMSTLTGTEHLHVDWTLEREYGLTHTLPAVSRVWQRENGLRLIATKGAPETVAVLCRMSLQQSEGMLAQVDRLARRGLRVLAVAVADLAEATPPADLRELRFNLQGLLAFQDPLRPTATKAVREAQQAGIAVVMITGDFPATAHAIACEAGIDRLDPVITGPMVDAMDDARLAEIVRQAQVFARIRPEQKLRLVEAFKANGEIVAMTGDGVNDAPALKAAHIGLALGSRATDVAREAAGIVMLDDDVGCIVAGIRMGRRIFNNLRKVLIYIIAIHVPIAGLALLPLLLGLPPILMPMHVVLIEMVVDPICSIAFESTPEESDIMRRRPRSPHEALMDWRQLTLGIIQGALLLTISFGIYYTALAMAVNVGQARALTFVALTVGNLMLVRVNASHEATLPHLFDRGYQAFWIVAAIAIAVLAGCLIVPGLATIFRFALPSPLPLFIAVIGGIMSVLLFDVVKLIKVR